MPSLPRPHRGPGGDRPRDAETPVSGAMDETGFRLDIQGLRGFALVLVLATHAELPFTSGGFVGLDVFFVLSGFLITGLILKEADKKGRVSLLRFYARRARRLLPLAVTVLVVICAGSYAFFGPVQAYKVAGDVIAATLYFANWHFMAQETEYFAYNSSETSPVQHYWSLSVEEQFYLLWPVLIVAVLWFARRHGWSLRRLLWVVLAPIGIASLVYGIWFSGVDAQQSYFSSLGRVWELGIGCALALALPAGLRLPKWASAVLTAGGIAVLVAGTVMLSAETPYPGWAALAPTLAAAAVIVAGTSVTVSGPIRVLSTAPFQYLGRISYAWYLWHWPALIFAAAAFGELSTLDKTMVTLAAWVPTVVTHHLIEERFRRSPTLARRPRRALALGFSCSAAAVILALSLATFQATVPTASADEAPGAPALDRGEKLQTSARAIRPNPRRAEDDRGRVFEDRCHLKGSKRVTSPDCVYGDRSSNTTVINIGDSHGMMYAPAGIELAKRRGWRFVNLTRAGCTTADVSYERRCDQWRENSLRRIEAERASLVIVSNGIDGRYRLRKGGRKLSRSESQPLLRRGFKRSLRRMRRSGARVVVIRDMARAPKDVVDCVAANSKRLRRCAFKPRRSARQSFDAQAARRVRRAKLVDPLPTFCPRQSNGARLCPAVIGGVLVYRNDYHLTATFAETLAPWLGRRLPKIAPREHPGR